MGFDAGSNFMIMGFSTSWGKNVLIRSALSLTFNIAISISFPQLKVNVIILVPSTDLDSIFFTPLTLLRASSRGLVTRFRISLGEAFSYAVMTVTLGNSMLGNKDTFNFAKEMTPIIRIPRNIIEVVTLYFVANLGNFILLFTLIFF